MKVVLERKGFQYVGLQKDGYHVFRDLRGGYVICREAKFVEKTGEVKFCNYGRPIEARRSNSTVSVANVR